MHADQKLYLVFEFLDVDLKRYMDNCNRANNPLSLDLVKVSLSNLFVSIFIAGFLPLPCEAFHSCGHVKPKYVALEHVGQPASLHSHATLMRSRDLAAVGELNAGASSAWLEHVGCLGGLQFWFYQQGVHHFAIWTRSTRHAFYGLNEMALTRY